MCVELRLLDLAEIVGSELDLRGGDVLGQAVQLGGTRDRDEPRLLRQNPGECDLGGCRVLALGDLGQEVDEGAIRLPCLRAEAGNTVAEVGAVERRVLVTCR